MALTSLSFLVCFVIFLLCILGINKINNKELKNNICKYFLLILSYVFLLTYNVYSCLYLAVLTVITYFVSLKSDKKICLVSGIVISVLGLCICKYYNFFMTSFCSVFKTDSSYIKIIAPLGISFYTFNVISYLADIYRNEYKSEKDFSLFALYLVYFPKIISGPLMKGKQFFEQFHNGLNINKVNINIGFNYITVGLFKKLVLAGHLSVFADDIFRVHQIFSSGTLLWGILSYTFQIYFDFSGYTDIAIGISKCFGIELPQNFNLPYISKNMTEFWSRWHISLSQWIKYYLYIPLGGNRKGQIRTYINLMLMMLISGLWHGAGWNFILWGGFHGLGLCTHKFCFGKYKKIKRVPNFWKDFSSIAITFIYVAFCWIFFRAENINQAFSIIKNIFCWHTGVNQYFTWTYLAIAVFFGSIIYSVIKCKKEKSENIDIKYPILDLSTIKGLTLFFILIGLTVILGYFGDTSFIYGKF